MSHDRGKYDPNRVKRKTIAKNYRGNDQSTFHALEGPHIDFSGPLHPEKKNENSLERSNLYISSTNANILMYRGKLIRNKELRAFKA